MGCAPVTSGGYFAPPGTLPHTDRSMKTAGFWISRHPSPDKIILSPQEIVAFNQNVQNRLGLTKNLAKWPVLLSGKDIKPLIKANILEMKEGGYLLENGRPADEDFFAGIIKNINLDAMPETITRQFGIVAHYADQRFLPTKESLYEKPDDPDFDYLQNSTLDVGVPVVVVHKSTDQQWYYAESSASAGWVEADKITLVDEDQAMEFMDPKSFIVVTDPKADIFADEEMTRYYDYVLMGVRLPLVRATKSVYEVQLPLRGTGGKWQKGYVPVDQAHEGYLAYTPRVVLTQAFKLLNTPYGWGGMYGEQDCSRFVQEVFAVVGIELPRDSKNQAKAGLTPASFAAETTDEGKLSAISKNAVGGITLLNLKGHIMLFVGDYESRLYGIHAIWAYRLPGKGQDSVYVLNRVALSDLSLGEGSKRGSLLKRLQSVSLIQK